MALILSIETSTRNCSVALSDNDRLLALREADQGNEHAARIAVFVDEVLREAGKRCADIDAVAVGSGPGSYTGLRIGVSTAKGLAYSLGCPLIAVSPLQAMAVAAAERSQKENNGNDAFFCPMTDAGRMEVYAALYDGQGREVRPICADIVNEDTYSDYLRQKQVVFCGDGCGKCRAVLQAAPNALFYEDIRPSARYMPILASRAYARSGFEDVAYFEPFYLKDFIAGKPHVKGLA
ncbi:MAG: tRNA (adenosine(37)-N6)-threonylcarbamoyltransferase complex dimerization subunit type 1 TsaB [Bacteroidales bacterium]|nr:tRNA (adenosine(37)-N6)-threonylcarbamoyltransferase complex dimerization subunit type 1 TsaB [Bacteroidales bacterium]